MNYLDHISRSSKYFYQNLKAEEIQEEEVMNLCLFAVIAALQLKTYNLWYLYM